MSNDATEPFFVNHSTMHNGKFLDIMMSLYHTLRCNEFQLMLSLWVIRDRKFICILSGLN